MPDHLGVSNVSFGLHQPARAFQPVFLHEAVEAGLDAAIVNAAKSCRSTASGEREREVARQLIYDERRFEGDVCTYDPLRVHQALEGVRRAKKRRMKPSCRSKSD